MIKYLKIFSTWLIVIVILLNSEITCICYDTVCGYVNVPSQVGKGKNFTVNLQVQCNGNVGVIMFTLVHGSGIEYKSCKVNDGSCGYIESSYSDNTLSVIYINTQGITVTEKTNLIDVTFGAENTVITTEIQVYTSYGASADENPLVSDSGRVYNIDIVENVTNTESAEGTKVKNSSDSVSKSSSSAVNKEIPNIENETEEIKATNETTTLNNNIIVVNSSNKNLFFAGTSFATAVVIVIAVSYKTGKKNADKNK